MCVCVCMCAVVFKTAGERRGLVVKDSVRCSVK